MKDTPYGIHHVTAISGDPQVNVDFYTAVLGLRFIKRTVNFDDPGTYHLYYGDEEGRPGTVMTFFAWQAGRRGSLGTGQAGTTAFSVPEGSLGFWRQRLESAGAPVEDPRERFDEEVLAFADPDGLRLELVAHRGAADRAPWHDGPVPPRNAIRSFHGVTLLEGSLEPTAEVLTATLGYQAGEVSGARHRFRIPGDGPASVVDVVVEPHLGRGQVAVGSVHHVAFRISGREEQATWRERAMERGLHITEVRDRKYFQSVYFREPGGVLFEIATDQPGFTVDEAVEELGTSLRLPEWLEPERAALEATLPDLAVPVVREIAS